jgi:hypothetical protein
MEGKADSDLGNDNDGYDAGEHSPLFPIASHISWMRVTLNSNASAWPREDD